MDFLGGSGDFLFVLLVGAALFAMRAADSQEKEGDCMNCLIIARSLAHHISCRNGNQSLLSSIR
jgi:hypothetical protein